MASFFLQNLFFVRPLFGFILFMSLHLGSFVIANNPSNQLPYYHQPELLLSKYVQIPSVTGVEKVGGEYFAEISRKLGLHVRVFTDELDSYNFAASLYPLEQGKPNIILLNHIDVVPAGDSLIWSVPPFSGQIKDGKVWGRGAIDNKGQAVMQLLALSDFVGIAQNYDLPYNFTMLSVSGEETGGVTGAAVVTERYLEELNPVVVYGEGGAGVRGMLRSDSDFPFFGISVAQKRGLWLSLEAKNNVSGHGSTPQKQYPTREIVKASNALLNEKPQVILSPTVKSMVKELARYEQGRRRFVMRNIGLFAPFYSKTLREDPLLSAMITNTVTLTGFSSAAVADNQISTQARAVFDCRLLPHTCTQSFIRHVEKAIEDYDVTLKIIHETPDAPPSEKGPYYEVLARALHSSYDFEVGVAPLLFMANNDNVYFRIKGIPAYGLLPAVLTPELLKTIHMADERMPIQSLYDGIEVYRNLIKLLINDNLLEPLLSLERI